MNRTWLFDLSQGRHDTAPPWAVALARDHYRSVPGCPPFGDSCRYVAWLLRDLA